MLYSFLLGWDSDVAAILLLVQLLPPTVKTRKLGKVSTAQAAGRVVKFMKVSLKITRLRFICLAGSDLGWVLRTGTFLERYIIGSIPECR